MDVTLARWWSALNPAVGGRLESFREAVDALRAAPAGPRVVAVVGLVPGACRSTVTALMALAAAAYSDRRVVVIDTVTPPAGPRTAAGGVLPRGDVAARTVTALLGGDVLQGRLPLLLEGAVDAGIPRRRVAAALTPDAAVPVLSLPPGPGGFAPQLLERTLNRLTYRADLILLDTPAGPRAPVLHAVLDLADHFLLVARADQDIRRQAAAGRVWLTSAPGRPRVRPWTTAVVCRGLRPPRPEPGIPMTVLRRDEALRRRRPDRLSRPSMVTGLRMVKDALAAPVPAVPVTA